MPDMDHDETCACAECVREREIAKAEWDGWTEDAQRAEIDDRLRTRGRFNAFPGLRGNDA